MDTIIMTRAKYRIDSREDWLNAAVAELRPMFLIRGYKLPAKIRASVGFPGGGKRATAEHASKCWAAINGKDGAFDLFVSPYLDEEVKVLGALTHNLIHAAVGVKSGHRAPFQQCAQAMGLEPPWVETVEGSAFKAGVARPVLLSLNTPYPHARLSAADINTSDKKQSTRLIKCECPTCGYITRTTMKWILAGGEPLCPNPKCKKQPMDAERDEINRRLSEGL